MLPSEKKPYQDPDEVNLLPILTLISKFFSKIKESISYAAYLVRKRTLFIASFVFFGIALAIVNFFVSTAVYKTNAILVSNLLSNDYCKSLIETLGELTKEKNYDRLSEKLNLPVGTVSKLNSIDFNYFTASETRDTVIGIPFSIEVYVTDNFILDSLQNGIVYYLENNGYALKRKSAKKAVLNEFSQKIDTELDQLDSLLKQINKEAIIDPKTGNFAMYDPIDNYEKMIDIYQEKYKVMERIALLSNFEVIEGFTKYNKPSSPRMIRDSAFMGGILFFVGLYFANKEEKKAKDKNKKHVGESEEKELV